MSNVESALRKATALMIQEAVSTEEGMNRLIDRMLWMIQDNEHLKERNNEHMLTIRDLTLKLQALEEAHNLTKEALT